MRLQELCDGIVDDVDGGLACALVDLETGLPLASKIAPGGILNPVAMEAIAAAGADYFRGKAVRRLEGAMSTGGESGSSFVTEIQTTTEDTYHFMSVVPGQANTLMLPLHVGGSGTGKHAHDPDHRQDRQLGSGLDIHA